MDYFNYKWSDYIDNNWCLYVKYPAFFSYKNSNIIKCYDGGYEDKLEEEFNKYFDAKKKYVSMSSEFEEKFGNYELIEIKDYASELEEYKERVDLYSKELYRTILNLVGSETMEKIKDIDFRLLLLGYIDTENYKKFIKYFSRIYNKANAFLSGYFEYYNYLSNYVTSSLLDISFHDCKIIDIIMEDKDVTLVIEDGYWPYDKVYNLKFINIDKDIVDQIELNVDILSNSLYYNNDKYYYYLEISDVDVYEFICDDIELDIIKK